jgi:hypothetical protein
VGEKGGNDRTKTIFERVRAAGSGWAKTIKLQLRCEWLISIIEGRIGGVGRGRGIGAGGVESLPVGIEKRVPRYFERRRIGGRGRRRGIRR